MRGRCLSLFGGLRAPLGPAGASRIGGAEALREEMSKPEHSEVERFLARYFEKSVLTENLPENHSV